MDLETRLKIKADTTEAKKLGQVIKQTFSKEQIKEFSQANQDLEKQFVSLTKKQVELNKALNAAKKGTEAYKKLRAELRGVRDESTRVGQSLTQLDRILNRSRREQAAIARQGMLAEQQTVLQQRAGRGRNLVAGMAQGLGIAPYVPTEPGMGYRIGGAITGGALRRIGGITAAPFQTPGIAGIARGVAGIPGIGGFGAGALQTAASVYQAAVGFDRQRLANLYFAGPQMGEEYRYLPEERRQALREAVGGSVKAQRVLEEARRGMGPRALKAGRGGRAEDQNLIRQSIGASPWVAMAQGLSEGVSKDLRSKDEIARDQAQAAKMDVHAARTRLTNANKERDQALKAAKEAVGFRSGLGEIGLGTYLGIGPSQMEQMKGAFFGQRGGRFDLTGRVQFMQSMLAGRRYGVTQEQAGGFFRGLQPGGGGIGRSNLIEALQAAVAQGLEGSRVPEYLQEMVSLSREAESKGMKFDYDAFIRQTMQLRQVGVQGPQLARIGGGIQRAAMGLGMRGVQGPMDMVLARAYGYNPEEGPRSYARSMLRMTGAKIGGGPEGGSVANLLRMVTQGAAGAGGSPEEQALFTMRALGRMGVPVGGDIAQALFQGFSTGKMPDISGLVRKQQAQRGVAGAMAGARQRIKFGAPTAVGAAEMEALRVSIGRSATWVKDFEKNAMLTAKTANNFVKELEGLSKAVGAVVKKINSLTEGGAEGFVKNIWKLITSD